MNRKYIGVIVAIISVVVAVSLCREIYLLGFKDGVDECINAIKQALESRKHQSHITVGNNVWQKDFKLKEYENDKV